MQAGLNQGVGREWIFFGGETVLNHSHTLHITRADMHMDTVTHSAWHALTDTHTCCAASDDPRLIDRSIPCLALHCPPTHLHDDLVQSEKGTRVGNHQHLGSLRARVQAVAGSRRAARV